MAELNFAKFHQNPPIAEINSANGASILAIFNVSSCVVSDERRYPIPSVSVASVKNDNNFCTVTSITNKNWRIFWV